jgi:hypothetical protein
MHPLILPYIPGQSLYPLQIYLYRTPGTHQPTFPAPASIHMPPAHGQFPKCGGEEEARDENVKSQQQQSQAPPPHQQSQAQ